MRTIAVLPIKSFESAKQRLSEALRGGSRNHLAQAMFFDVLAALRRARRIDAVAVVTDDHEIAAVLRGDPVTVIDDDARDGQSAAARIGIEHAVAEGFDRILLVPGDTPLVESGEVDRLLDSARTEGLGAVIVPDRHRTGTNALLIAPPDALEPRFGPASLERHLAAAREADLSHRVEDVPSLMHDVDTGADLADLAPAIEGRRGVAPRTRGALRQLDRLQVHRPDFAAAGEPGAGESPAGEAPEGEGEPATEPRFWRPRREGASDGRPAWV